MSKCLEAAIKYVTQYGWAVFPVSPETKKPLTPHGCKDAKKLVGPIRAWWKRWPDASVGVATGSISNLIVIDEDIDELKGINGYLSVSEWERENGELPETARSITGRGGNHIYYHYTGSDIGNRAGILEGVDIRGEGGYVIAPPSRHPNGTEYAWEYDPDEIPLATLDDTVLKFLGQRSHKSASDEDFKVPTVIKNGERNDTLFRLACSLQAQGMPDPAILAALKETNQTACADPLDDSEIEVIASSALKYNKGELKIVSSDVPEWHEPELTMQLDKDGNLTDKPAQTIANAEEAILYDKGLYGRIRYNELAYAPYSYGNLPWKSHKGWREWTNADDSNLRSYIEAKYHLKSAEKIMDALTNVAVKFPVNPVQNMLENCFELWDGNKHVENLLPSMLGCEKTDYTIEVMRIFMLGAVARAYKPGCKFDYMLVLVGPQGKGKSSFLRYLALNDAWYNDNFSTLDSARAVENLRGMWIVELAELQATRRAKDVETIKSFITSRVDTYRAPYGRRTEQRPRMCVLAGTSNPVDFLTDKTGNRRFLPITCGIHKPTFDMFANDITTKHEMMQAWGEIMNEYQQTGGKPRLVLPKHLEEEALAAQTAYLEEDPRIGIIQEWLDTNKPKRVCVMMLWREPLGHLYEDPKPSDVNALHEIMKNNVAGYVYVGKKKAGGVYGTQRCYDRIGEVIEGNADELPDEVPFDS